MYSFYNVTMTIDYIDSLHQIKKIYLGARRF